MEVFSFPAVPSCFLVPVLRILVLPRGNRSGGADGVGDSREGSRVMCVRFPCLQGARVYVSVACTYLCIRLRSCVRLYMDVSHSLFLPVCMFSCMYVVRLCLRLLVERRMCLSGDVLYCHSDLSKASPWLNRHRPHHLLICVILFFSFELFSLPRKAAGKGPLQAIPVLGFFAMLSYRYLLPLLHCYLWDSALAHEGRRSTSK